MNLISELFLNLNYNDRTREYKAEAANNTHDYGYALYQSLEYDFKYLKSDDFRFGESLLNTIKK